MTGRSPAVVLVAVVTALLLVLAGCSSRGATKTSTRTASVRLDPGAEARLRLASGVEVDVPKGAVHGKGTLRGGTATSPGSPGEGVRAGTVYDLHVSGTTLAAPVTLRLPVRAEPATQGLAAPKAALLAYWDASTKAWTPVEAAYDAATGTVTAETPHLSLWTVLTVDTKKVLRSVEDFVTGFVGAQDTVAQPACPDESKAKGAGIVVASDSGNLVKWCVGVGSNGAGLLRVANNRHYAVETDYPSAWSVQRVGPADTVFDSALRAMAHAASPTPRGTSSVIIGGGDTVEFTIPAGTGGRANTTPSVEAYLISGLVFGAETLAMTFGQIPGAKADPSKTAKAINLAAASKSCLQTLDELDHHDIDSAQAVGELFRSVANYATGCLADQWKIAYGLTGFLASFTVGVLLWLVDGVKLVIDGVRAAIDTAIFWRSYRIAVSTGAAPVAAVSATSLLTAPVPAMCQHDAGRLVNGSLPGLTDQTGYEDLDIHGTAAPGPGGFIPPLFLDVTGDGAGDAAAVIHCSAGGVSWPDLVLFYGPGTTLIGQVDPSDVHRAEHANVETMTPLGRDVRITWNTTDGCCDDPQEWTAVLHWDGKRVVVTQPTRIG